LVWPLLIDVRVEQNVVIMASNSICISFLRRYHVRSSSSTRNVGNTILSSIVYFGS
jgi:hypothetical protein